MTPPTTAWQLRPSRELLICIALASAYFITAKLGLRLASINPSATAVWAPTGIALAAFLTLGNRGWPGIFLGAFLANAATAGSLITSVCIAGGNTLEGLLGAYLVNRFAGGSQMLDRTRDVFRFTLLAGLVSTTVSPTIGVTSLALNGFAEWSSYWEIWRTWWLGDAVGALVVAPLILAWSKGGRITMTKQKALEGAALLLYLFLVGHVVFGAFFTLDVKRYPLDFLCVPFLIWAAVRFGPKKSTAAVLVLSAVATWGTLNGSGPFARETRHESLLLLQAFMGVMSVMTLTLAAVVAERKQAEQKVTLLATTDALTGLANYRKLTDDLEREIQRSDRSGRPFSLLLLDVDGLKQINDTHGHLAGSRALCRVAAALRMFSRTIDTAARYGGDEFALILPEARATMAREVGRRICDRLAADAEKPAVSVSLGYAEYPDNGTTFHELLRTADAAMYTMKGEQRPGRTLARQR